MSKARKIARRTLVGGALALAVALLLWLSSQSPTGAPLFAVAAIVAIGAALELSRMGTVGLLEAFPAFLCAVVGALVLAQASFEARLGAHDPSDPVARAAPLTAEIARAYAASAVCAAAAFAVAAAARRHLRSPSLARLLAYACVGGALLWALRGFGSEPAGLWPALLALAVLALVASASFARRAEDWGRVVKVAALGAWIAVPLPLLWTFWITAGGSGDPALRTRALVALIVLSKIGDTAGYYVGSAIGRSHPFPKISPGKTTAGCVASLVAAVIVAGVLYGFGVLPPGRFGLASALAAGAIVNVAAQAGDLLESWVKRRAGVKDSSTVFGPSGGLLDQIDSLLVSAPLAALIWPVLFAA